jgi:hypothetical protein
MPDPPLHVVPIATIASIIADRPLQPLGTFLTRTPLLPVPTVAPVIPEPTLPLLTHHRTFLTHRAFLTHRTLVPGHSFLAIAAFVTETTAAFPAFITNTPVTLLAVAPLVTHRNPFLAHAALPFLTVAAVATVAAIIPRSPLFPIAALATLITHGTFVTNRPLLANLPLLPIPALVTETTLVPRPPVALVAIPALVTHRNTLLPGSRPPIVTNITHRTLVPISALAAIITHRTLLAKTALVPIPAPAIIAVPTPPILTDIPRSPAIVPNATIIPVTSRLRRSRSPDNRRLTGVRHRGRRDARGFRMFLLALTLAFALATGGRGPGQHRRLRLGSELIRGGCAVRLVRTFIRSRSVTPGLNGLLGMRLGRIAQRRRRHTAVRIARG